MPSSTASRFPAFAIFLRFGGALLSACLLLGFSLRAQEPAPLIDRDHPVFAAVRNGNVPEVMKHLENGVSVNATSDLGFTVLRVALDMRNLALADAILERGFKPTMIYKSGSNGEFAEIGYGALSAAVKARAEAIVDRLLSRGATAFPRHYARDPFADDPVRLAVEADSLSLAKKLFAGATKESLTEFFLHRSYSYLVACKSPAMIELLVSHGADVEHSDSTRPNPHVLHTYAKRNWPEGVATLLSLHADPTVADRDGKLPADFATNAQVKSVLQIEALRLRVRRESSNFGADPDKTPFPLAILERALVESESAGLRTLEQRPAADLEATDDRGWTPLTYALSLRLTRLAAALVERGADVNHTTTFGSAMAAFATSTGDLDLVRKMAAKGMDVNGAKNGASTALANAAKAGNLPMIELLLSLGAQVEPRRPASRDATWVSPLMVAVSIGDIAVMERLLKAGGDIHAVDSYGQNVVFHAVHSGKVEVLQWTLNQGAYPHLKTSGGENPLSLAISLNSLPLIRELVRVGVTHPDAVALARRRGLTEAVTLLQSQQKDASPDDPADLWTRFDFPGISTAEVRAYIARGGDVNYAKGCPTPLQAMTKSGNVEAVKLLLEAGADPRKRGANMGNPTFSLAIDFHSDEVALELLRLFIQHGLSPDERDYYVGGQAADAKEGIAAPLLHHALSRGRLKCVRYLLEAGANPYLPIVKGGGDSAFDVLRDSNRFDDVQRVELRWLMEEHGEKFAPEKKPAQPGQPAEPATPAPPARRLI